MFLKLINLCVTHYRVSNTEQARPDGPTHYKLWTTHNWSGSSTTGILAPCLVQRLLYFLYFLPWLRFLCEKYGLNMRARSIAKHLTSMAASTQNSNTHTHPMTSGIIESVGGRHIKFKFEIRPSLADNSQ